MDATHSRGARTNLHGISELDLAKHQQHSRTDVRTLLDSAANLPLKGEEERARTAIEDAWKGGLDGEGEPTPEHGQCLPEAAPLPDPSRALEALTERTYACFGEASERVALDGKDLDRLTVMSLLSETQDPETRKRLFLSLNPIWNAVAGDGGDRSPYRRLLNLRTKQWSNRDTPFEKKAQEFGVDLSTVEQWLKQALLQWKALNTGAAIEPWDFFYLAGQADRALRPNIPKNALEPLARSYYAAMGAPPEQLGIHFDLEPRPGKDPVAFTTFAARNSLQHGAWVQGEFWVFASYQVGGLGNLAELLHETGHGIHLAAIRTRPAFEDWPDSDTFTEALADMTGVEVFEPAWQQRYLGTSVPLAESLRSKYAGIVLDMAWALFEIEMHRHPDRAPNEVWTRITQDYLGIKPHPELAWWAMRGQLVDSPGYMLNYGMGSFITAQLRQRVKTLLNGKSFTSGGAELYGLLSNQIYRFGLERSSREVFEAFVGDSLSPAALLQDMARIGAMQSSLRE